MCALGHVITVGVPRLLNLTVAELHFIVNKELANVVIGTFSKAAGDEADAAVFHEIDSGTNGRVGIGCASVAAHYAEVALVAKVVQCVWRCHNPRIGGVILPIGRKGTRLEVEVVVVPICAPIHWTALRPVLCWAIAPNVKKRKNAARARAFPPFRLNLVMALSFLPC